jgi:hypothetical protein
MPVTTTAQTGQASISGQYNNALLDYVLLPNVPEIRREARRLAQILSSHEEV